MRKKIGKIEEVLTIWNLELEDRDRERPSLEKIMFWWNGAWIGDDCAVGKMPSMRVCSLGRAKAKRENEILRVKKQKRNETEKLEEGDKY